MTATITAKLESGLARAPAWAATIQICRFVPKLAYGRLTAIRNGYSPPVSGRNQIAWAEFAAYHTKQHSKWGMPDDQWLSLLEWLFTKRLRFRVRVGSS